MLTEEKRQALKKRNDAIIELIKEKEKRECPGTLEFIGIAGSFCNGDYHEKSDLDLMIVVNDEKKAREKLDLCFILEDVGHDIHVSNWDVHERKAKYGEPYVTKLIDLDIKYVKDAAALEKYMSLQDTLLQNMKKDGEIKNSLEWQFASAKGALDELEKIKDKTEAYSKYCFIVRKLEFCLYMHNKSYIKRGLKRIPEEIARLENLPEGFLTEYNECSNIHSEQEAKTKAKKLVGIVEKYLKSNGYEISKLKQKGKKVEKQKITGDALTGVYEEMFSNYYNKLRHAVDIDNRYLSFRALADAQVFMDTVGELCTIDKFHFIDRYNPDDLQGNVKVFEEGLAKIRKLYARFDKPIENYHSFEEFREKYIGDDGKFIE